MLSPSLGLLESCEILEGPGMAAVDGGPEGERGEEGQRGGGYGHGGGGRGFDTLLGQVGSPSQRNSHVLTSEFRLRLREFSTRSRLLVKENIVLKFV